ncbi:AMED_5909 family protein [Saccharothrix mutabilis subsp. mutabilis]|uniref:AMED_5909 family protein n=1 Tax=Saccharothrix mutabilis subsp. mutabilis TaxID=66855 RepID=A0ABN0TN47_9PSEU
MKRRRTDLWAEARAVQTLKDAHEALSRLIPAPNADERVWRTFYLRSARIYAQVAEVDRGHHHEALYWANRERQKGEQIEPAGGGDAAEEFDVDA